MGLFLRIPCMYMNECISFYSKLCVQHAHEGAKKKWHQKPALSSSRYSFLFLLVPQFTACFSLMLCVVDIFSGGTSLVSKLIFHKIVEVCILFAVVSCSSPHSIYPSGLISSCVVFFLVYLSSFAVPFCSTL